VKLPTTDDAETISQMDGYRREGQTTVPEARHTVVSLFSGAGGMDIGLEETGRFVTLACVEKGPACGATLRANRDAGRLGAPNLHVFETDISDLDPQEVMRACGLQIGQLALLAGGPPCQTFSTAGSRAAIQDPRGMLLWEFLRFVAAFRPGFS